MYARCGHIEWKPAKNELLEPCQFAEQFAARTGDNSYRCPQIADAKQLPEAAPEGAKCTLCGAINDLNEESVKSPKQVKRLSTPSPPLPEPNTLKQTIDWVLDDRVASGSQPPAPRDLQRTAAQALEALRESTGLVGSAQASSSPLPSSSPVPSSSPAQPQDFDPFSQHNTLSREDALKCYDAWQRSIRKRAS